VEAKSDSICSNTRSIIISTGSTAYGGNGNGAAIVFDTAKIAAREESPLVIAHVHYGTAEDRKNCLQLRIAEFAEIVTKADILDDKLSIASYYFSSV
jgi:hypothetical protein